MLEVGTGEKGVKQVAQTMGKAQGNFGVIFYSGKLELDEKNNVVSTLWNYFLLI